MKDLDISGIFPPLVTPFNEDESIAWDKLENNLQKLNTTPISGYLVLGSSGEACLLTKEEKIQIVEKVRKLSPKEKLIIAGSGCESTSETINLTRALAEAGAHAVAVVTPGYVRLGMTKDALKQHYVDVADASPVPVLMYSVPVCTGVDIPVCLITELADHSNIVGIKESSGDWTKCMELVRATKDKKFAVLVGTSCHLLAAMQIGASGIICGLANFLTEEICHLRRSYKEGKEIGEEEIKLQMRITNLGTVVGPRFVAGLKHCMELRGMDGGSVRRPLQPLGKETVKEITDCMKNNRFA